MSESDDDFDAYDFSEFTDQDLAAIDAHLARAHGGPAIQIAIEDSPFNKFLSWKKHIAVTDLVSPLWCEVQYEYSLYGKRHKPLHLRPSAFTAKTGKQIRVHQQVAHANDRRLKRGKSVHKALEDELYPDKLVVHVVSGEERFGLRLLQLIDGFNQLVSNGIVRELPVFAITHAQVVLGVIDEVVRAPLTQGIRDQLVSPRSLSSTPSGSPPKKKQRQLSPPMLQQITSPAQELPTAMNTGHVTDPTNPENLYELRIVDYKTRQSSTIPLDEDILSPRLQLMTYHRMLSSLLEPETFDFDLLWSRLNLSANKPLSAQFLKDILWEQRRVDSTDCNVNLNRLVSEWISTVQRKRPGLIGVSRQLRVVFRRSVYAGKRGKGKHKATETEGMGDSFEALALQEELDLARAIEESLGETGHQKAGQVSHHQTDPTLAWAIQQSLLTQADQAQVPANNLQRADVLHDDPPFEETKPVVLAPKEQVQEGATANISPIIGMKEFKMNDDELDAHLVDVLQWWFGTRPARGVDVSQTNRCFTCEYQDSCEWREQKAREAAALTSERKVQRGCNGI